jgi:hypothetical protein
MGITKSRKVDKIEVLENGCVCVRVRNSIIEDGNELAFSYERKVIEPGSNFKDEESRVAAICTLVHTPEIINAYQLISKGV